MADTGTELATSGGLRSLAQNITVSGNGLQPKSLAELMDFAQLMAKAGPMVGKSFRGNPGACLGIAMQAMNWGMSPFAVSQKAFVTTDRDGAESIGYESQLVNAVINAHAPIMEPLLYEYEGEGGDRVCIVSATLRRASRPSIYRSPPLKACAARSPLWKSDPDQQLGYYASRAWARRYCPEVLMGVYTVEEIAEGAIIDVTATPAPARIGTEIITDEGVATTIIPKSAHRCRKDGDWGWFMEELGKCANEDDVDALVTSERVLHFPRAWREEDIPEAIDKHFNPTETAGQRASPTQPASPAASASEEPNPSDARTPWSEIATALAKGPQTAQAAASLVEADDALDAITIIKASAWAKKPANAAAANTLCDALEKKRREAA